ncbi:MAG: glycosyltransferase [Acidimicrobiales bacterium]
MSARFLVTCWPFVGHVVPQISIASALRSAGHEVAFYTGEGVRPLIEAEGFELFPFKKVDEAAVLGYVKDLETQTKPGVSDPRLLRRTLRKWLVETIPDQVADLRPLLASWKPDVLITDMSMWSSIVILWEATPIPVALSSTFLGPLVPGPDAPPWGLGMKAPRRPVARLVAKAITTAIDLAAKGMRRRVDELRAQHGLGPLGMSVNAFTGKLPLYLVGNLPELDYNRRDLPDTVHYLGTYQWHPPTSPETVAWLDSLPTEHPWIHVTESTLRHGDPFLLRAAADGLGGHPYEVVATTGFQRHPRDLPLGPLPDNVHLTQWVSHPALLPRCAAVVTTGGAATIMAALVAGLPLVIVPTTWDKSDNARRVVDAGVGVWVPTKKCTPEALRDAVVRVTTDKRYRTRAEQFAARLADAPGPAGAARLLADLATQAAAT